jgi:hypothetical protein
VPVDFLCAGRVLRQRVSGCLHGLQPEGGTRPLYCRGRQVPGPAGHLHREVIRHLQHHRNLSEREMRALRQGHQLQSRLLCQRILSHAGLDLRREWVMCSGERSHVREPDLRVGVMSGRMWAWSSAMLKQQRSADLHDNGELGGGGFVQHLDLRLRCVYRSLRKRYQAMFGQHCPDLWHGRELAD